MKYIGIDMGSSFMKAVLLDLETGEMSEQRTASAMRRIPGKNSLRFEIPASQVAESVKHLIDGYTAEFTDIEGVVFSVQMHGFVYEVPKREDIYISWQDMRCMEMMQGKEQTWLQYLEEQIPPSDMEANGVYIKPSLGMCNLFTLLHGDGFRDDGSLYTLGSYVIYCLTGNNVCHISSAAPLGLADAGRGVWDRNMISRMGFGKIRLPRIAGNDFEVCGIYESNGCRLKIYPDYGDMQVSTLGSGICGNEVVVNVATGAQVIRYSRSFEPGSYEIRPYFDGAYLNTISNMPAGRNLDVLVDFFARSAEVLSGVKVDGQSVWNYVHRHMGRMDEELRVRTSFYKNPYYSEGGAITGITQSNLSIENLFSAAIEDMAQTYWKHIHDLGTDVEHIKRIICSGGVCWKTPELCRAIGRVSRKKTEMSAMKNEALAGLFRLSLAAEGSCGCLDEPPKLVPHLKGAAL